MLAPGASTEHERNPSGLCAPARWRRAATTGNARDGAGVVPRDALANGTHALARCSVASVHHAAAGYRSSSQHPIGAFVVAFSDRLTEAGGVRGLVLATHAPSVTQPLCRQAAVWTGITQIWSSYFQSVELYRLKPLSWPGAACSVSRIHRAAATEAPWKT